MQGSRLTHRAEVHQGSMTSALLSLIRLFYRNRLFSWRRLGLEWQRPPQKVQGCRPWWWKSMGVLSLRGMSLRGARATRRRVLSENTVFSLGTHVCQTVRGRDRVHNRRAGRPRPGRVTSGTRGEDCVLEFLETNVKMTLLLLEVFTLFLVQYSDKLRNKISFFSMPQEHAQTAP